MYEVSKLSSFMASIATQIRAAIQVGVPFEDDVKARRSEECVNTLDPSATECDEAPGRMTRNGLGSLEIGAGNTRVDE
ncbi:MAG: hypothetical protein QY320_06880 [Gammaproteobacteria bacterium]|nr:MAG: hypothetical protein QY320_06880 [Gammaproteobacteria bacterium]